MDQGGKMPFEKLEAWALTNDAPTAESFKQELAALVFITYVLWRASLLYVALWIWKTGSRL